VYSKLGSLESQKQSLEVQVTQVRNEQRKILGSFVDLENRYKDIIHENRLIKSELADLRNNNHSNKVVIADSINMPLRRDDRASAVYTPGRVSVSHEDYSQ
jgi:predicted  nucleic acid-binding Zn-ribbon protein